MTRSDDRSLDVDAAEPNGAATDAFADGPEGRPPDPRPGPDSSDSFIHQPPDAPAAHAFQTGISAGSDIMSDTQIKHSVRRHSSHFASNWVAGADQPSKSLRRRLMAALRLAHRALGMKRDRLGLGALGTGGAVGGATLAVAGTAAAPATLFGVLRRARGLYAAVSLATLAAQLPTQAFAQVLVGPGSTNPGSASTAVGTSAHSVGSNSVALGTGTTATGDGSISIGYTNSTNGLNAIAIGVFSNAVGVNALALGGAAHAFADGATALGVNSTASGGNCDRRGQQRRRHRGECGGVGRQFAGHRRQFDRRGRGHHGERRECVGLRQLARSPAASRRWRSGSRRMRPPRIPSRSGPWPRPAALRRWLWVWRPTRPTTARSRSAGSRSPPP